MLALGPLADLSTATPIRIIVDGLDQLPTATSEAVYDALDQLAKEPVFKHIRLIVTSRPDTPLPFNAQSINIELAQDEQVTRYLQRRNVADRMALAHH